jgi:hypothetical protein
MSPAKKLSLVLVAFFADSLAFGATNASLEPRLLFLGIIPTAFYIGRRTGKVRR